MQTGAGTVEEGAGLAGTQVASWKHVTNALAATIAFAAKLLQPSNQALATIAFAAKSSCSHPTDAPHATHEHRQALRRRGSLQLRAQHTPAPQASHPTAQKQGLVRAQAVMTALARTAFLMTAVARTALAGLCAAGSRPAALITLSSRSPLYHPLLQLTQPPPSFPPPPIEYRGPAGIGSVGD